MQEVKARFYWTKLLSSAHFSDFHKLATDFPEVIATDYLQNCIELGTWHNEVYDSGGRWSLARLCENLVESTLCYLSILVGKILYHL